MNEFVNVYADCDAARLQILAQELSLDPAQVDDGRYARITVPRERLADIIAALKARKIHSYTG